MRRLLIKKLKNNNLVKKFLFPTIDLSKFTIKGNFNDSKGNNFTLYNELRSNIKPIWINWVNDTPFIPSQKNFNNLYNEGIFNAKELLNSIHPSILNKKDLKILEIGCHFGNTSIALSKLINAEITATDFSGYKVENSNDKDKDSANNLLHSVRSNLINKFSSDKNIKFIDDDICNSSLPTEYYDIIFSFDVLEHLNNSEMAFSNMKRLLKPNGIMYHKYNPFFGYNGGHSAATLDFLWGHVLLNENDFEKYLKTFRLNEFEKSFNFYKNGLNRISFNKMYNILKTLDFKDYSVIPIPRVQQINLVSPKTIEIAKENYQGITITDLISPYAIIFITK